MEFNNVKGPRKKAITEADAATRVGASSGDHASNAGDKQLVLPRRKVLGGLVLASAGAVMGTSAGPVMGKSVARAPLSPGNPMPSNPVSRLPELPPGAREVTGMKFGPDGLPLATVRGYLIAADEQTCVVAVPGRSSPVRILLTPSTEVNAGGQFLLGTTEACANGDRLLIGTSIDRVGRRVANYIVQNLHCYWTTVNSISGNELYCTNSEYGEQPWAKVVVRLNELTKLPHGAPWVNENLYVVSTGIQNTNAVWAMEVQNAGGWS